MIDIDGRATDRHLYHPRPVHIGFALLTLAPGRMGGSETYVRGLLREFGAGNGPERVTVLANGEVLDAYRPLARGGVALHRMPRYRPGRTPLSRAAAMVSGHLASRLIARAVPEGPALLHFPVTVTIPRTRLPEVVTLFDVQHHDLPAFFSPAERGFRRLTYDAAARRAAMVVTTSEYSRGRAVEVLGIAPDRIEAVPLGIDLARFSPEPAEGDAARLEALGVGRPYVLYPANLWPHKNHERLLDAMARAPSAELELLLTGQTYGRLGPLLERAARHGLGGRIRHLGYLDEGDLPALYRAARAMIFPSLYEGFGAPPLEAMASGCPVASSTRASLAEVCGDAALALDPESTEDIAAAIGRITGDDGLRARLAAKGLERARRFSWEAAAARHTAIYARVAATSPPSRR
jgi:glycosyltransferase involved in cell wall biosynthesis